MPTLAFRFGHETGGARFTERLAARAAELRASKIIGLALRAFHRYFIRTGAGRVFFSWWEKSRTRIAPPCLPGRCCDRLEELQIEEV
jgi:hypothetical protein